MDQFDTVIVGAGQAGLAAAYYCKQRHLRFTIIDSAKKIGDSWRYRYDKLVLFTPRYRNSLPGLQFPGNPRGYPSKDEVASYLESYADLFKFPVQFETRVLRLEKYEGTFTITTDRGKLDSSTVVIATGAFQKPYIPEVSRTARVIPEIHSSHYKNASQIPNGDVLVVGSGNSAAQIAVDLSISHNVALSVNKKLHFVSNRRNDVIMSVLEGLKILSAPFNSLRGKLLRQLSFNPIVGKELQKLISAHRIILREEVVTINDDGVTFRDGSTLTPTHIIWATGFKPDMRWIAIDGAVNTAGAPTHHSGISPVGGLYYVGQRWQRSVKSELMWGVSADADVVVTALSEYLDRS